MKLALALLLLQQLGALDAPRKATKSHISYVAEAHTIAAGKRATLELRFHIDEGFHVNSHTPKSETQIATKVDFIPVDGVKVWPAVYPAGKPFSFSVDPGDQLDVYSDDFIVKVPLIAAAGDHELKGELGYQACDHAACYPPRTLPVDIVFTAK
jgi:hypothetical protein